MAATYVMYLEHVNGVYRLSATLHKPDSIVDVTFPQHVTIEEVGTYLTSEGVKIPEKEVFL